MWVYLHTSVTYTCKNGKITFTSRKDSSYIWLKDTQQLFLKAVMQVFVYIMNLIGFPRVNQ